MSSAAEATRHPAEEPEEDRIVVRHLANGVVSIKYQGKNPETRYMPREPSVWSIIRDSWRLGGMKFR